MRIRGLWATNRYAASDFGTLLKSPPSSFVFKAVKMKALERLTHEIKTLDAT